MDSDDDLLPASFFTGAPPDLRPLDTPPLEDFPQVRPSSPYCLPTQPSLPIDFQPEYLNTDFSSSIITKPSPRQRLCPSFRPKRPHPGSAMSSNSGPGNSSHSAVSQAALQMARGNTMPLHEGGPAPRLAQSGISHQQVAPSGTYHVAPAAHQVPQGSSKLSPGAHKLSPGAHQLQSGNQLLLQGTHQIPQVTHQSPKGTLQLSQGTHQLPPGTHQLPQGTLPLTQGHQLPRGPQQLSPGSHQIPQATHQIPQGVHQIPQGTRQIAQATHQLPKAAHQYVAGTHRMSSASLLLPSGGNHLSASPGASILKATSSLGLNQPQQIMTNTLIASPSVNQTNIPGTKVVTPTQIASPGMRPMLSPGVQLSLSQGMRQTFSSNIRHTAVIGTHQTLSPESGLNHQMSPKPVQTGASRHPTMQPPQNLGSPQVVLRPQLVRQPALQSPTLAIPISLNTVGGNSVVAAQISSVGNSPVASHPIITSLPLTVSQQQIQGTLTLGNSSYITSMPSAQRVSVTASVSTPVSSSTTQPVSSPHGVVVKNQTGQTLRPAGADGFTQPNVLSGPARHMLGAVPAPQRPTPKPRAITSPPPRSLSTQYRNIQPKPPPLIPLPPGYQLQSAVNSPTVITSIPPKSPVASTASSSPRPASVPLNVPQIARRRSSLHSPPQVMSHPHDGLPESLSRSAPGVDITQPVFPTPSAQTSSDETQPINLTMKTSLPKIAPSPSKDVCPNEEKGDCNKGSNEEALDFSMSKVNDEPSAQTEIQPALDAVCKTEADHEKQASSNNKSDSPREENNNSKKLYRMISSEKKNDYSPMECEDTEFSWEEYLEEVNAKAAPPTSFKHVEASLVTAFEKGMILEVPNRSPSNTYWPATVVMACGPLLRLQHLGDNTEKDFWCDTCAIDVHPLGWCQDADKSVQPPDDLIEKLADWKDVLNKCFTDNASQETLKSKPGKAAIDQINTGMWLEIQHEMDPHYVWLVCIIENVGGRLLLRYHGAENAGKDFWLFYLNHRLHPMGWAVDMSYSYRAPTDIMKNSDNLLVEGMKMAEAHPFPSHLLDDQEQALEHGGFREGQKVEAINPANQSNIFPATVVRVIDERYFIVEIDNVSKNPVEQEKDRMCCHGGSAGVFPVHWCLQKGLRLAPPKGSYKGDFDWKEYLNKTNSEPAPRKCFNNLVNQDHQFNRGMKLEVANPMQPSHICAGTITRILDSLMWIHLDSDAKIMANHIVDVTSHDIFPVGWCESNNYPLKPPKRNYKKTSKRVAVVQPEKHMSADEYRSATYTEFKEAGEGNGWCPKIYFNHRCFSGAYLSKGRIAELPKCVGPGPVSLVMKEVLSMLINVAYKSSRVLRELQQEGDSNPNLEMQVLKAKYKGKSYRAKVEVCKSSEQIEEFLRQVCIKLESCPNLVSTVRSGAQCPDNCWQLTKTKYSAYFGKKKKRKIGRPPGGHTNLENGPKKPGKRGRGHYRRHLLASKSCEDNEGKDNGESGDLDSNSTGSVVGADLDITDNAEIIPGTQKRKYQRHVPAPLEMKTRGVKLPRYSFDIKRRMAGRPPRLLIQKEEPGMKKRRGRPPKEPPTPSPSISIKKEPDAGISPTRSVKEDVLKLTSNPLHWSVSQAIKFIKTTDCANLAHIFSEQEIDGQAMLLLSLPTVQELMELKLGPAIKLCHHIERLKIAFFEQWAT